MRHFVTSVILGGVGLLTLPAMAQPPDGGDKGDRPARGEMRERMLKEFDKDGDGILSDEERQKARESMRDRRGGGKKEGRPGAGRKPGDKKQGKKGANGPGGPMGRPPLPPPDELFKKFDADGSDSLSREEFGKLAEFLRSHRPQGPPPGGLPGRPGFRGRGPDGRGPDGPPRGDRRRGDRERPGRPDGPPAEGTPPKVEDAAGGVKKPTEESI
ncbi:MAG: hypothetical protein L0228_10270 [Planctomycetes bacterium]|nr:hypothetical protein [Planctomycetota bacterium]